MDIPETVDVLGRIYERTRKEWQAYDEARVFYVRMQANKIIDWSSEIARCTAEVEKKGKEIEALHKALDVLKDKVRDGST